MIKVAITDDHPLIVDGLCNALKSDPEFSIIGCYDTGARLFQGLRKELPDVLLLDLQLPDKNGQELVPLLLNDYPNLHILILSAMDSSPFVRELIKSGCRGYLLKSSTNQSQLIRAIKQVFAGELFIEPKLKEQLLEDMLATNRLVNKLNPKITQREKEVLKLISKEYSNQEIADQLFVSSRTIETHRYNLLQKLEVKNTVGLLRVAKQLGLVE
jgi:DNA-binding NarL/FixJ family response regulator